MAIWSARRLPGHVYDVLVDASNCRSGGGVQVAASFLDELTSLVSTPADVAGWSFTVLVSGPVARNLGRETRARLNIEIRDTRLWHFGRWLPRLRHHDVAFTIFGPRYRSCWAAVEIVGFADVTSLFPIPAGVDIPGGIRGLRWRLRALVSKTLFRRDDQLVVEAAHVKNALVARWGLRPESIHIVPNTPNAVFADIADEPAPPPAAARPLRLIYVTRAHPHKNIAFLAEVVDGLAARGVETELVLTLTDDEMHRLGLADRTGVTSVGPRNVGDLVELYRTCHVAVFPSLLECFSVTPLEAFAAGIPLVASDRDFVRDVAADAALYADPYDVDAWVDAVCRLTQDADLWRFLTRAGKDIVRTSPDAGDRARAYVELIRTASRTSGGDEPSTRFGSRMRGAHRALSRVRADPPTHGAGARSTG